ncbi:MAG: electron transfer flavoprotein subunit beta/FixA family protein [Armatimonadetes bacterium]|nr:electron transfer flavoprotein subunit beta/FixA family protein [Armatimonadota bacterium]
MRIAVCIKQVPQTTEVKIDPETHTLVREGVESQINPFDLYALEEGVRVKERLAEQGEESTVTVLTMGPPQAEAALREAISLGADEAVLISDRAFAGSDTWATSYALARALAKVDAALVFCGMQAIDGDTGQVGPGVAVHLDYAQAAYVAQVETIEKRTVVVKRLVENGYERVSLRLPAVITVVKEINEPRTPSLRGKMNAKKAQVPVWKAADIDAPEDKIGLLGSPTQVIKVFSPSHREGGQRWAGEPDELADKLCELLKEMEVV